jgi:hypothetical protein
MNGKDCSKCVYNDGMRADRTFRCCTPERQRDVAITDCCVPVLALRAKQSEAVDMQMFVYTTQHYIDSVKSKSVYWRTQQGKERQTSE